MDVASPIESRIAGRATAPGIPFTLTARKPITLATPFARDWRNRGFGLPNSSDPLASSTVSGDSDGGQNGRRRARYRSYHPPSATGEGQVP